MTFTSKISKLTSSSYHSSQTKKLEKAKKFWWKLKIDSYAFTDGNSLLFTFKYRTDDGKAGELNVYWTTMSEYLQLSFSLTLAITNDEKNFARYNVGCFIIYFFYSVWYKTVV